MSESAVESMLTPSGSQRPKRRARLNAKRKLTTSKEDEEIKRRRTFDTFYTFCNFVLEYEQKLASESVPVAAIAPPSPVNSAGESSSSSALSSSDTSSNGSDASDGAEGEGDGLDNGGVTEEGKLEYTSDDESWNLVTCFCRRPFAGRPMIECSKCKTWIHLFCARVKKDHVPDIYICPSCRPKSS